MSNMAKPMQILCKFIGVAPYSFDPGSSTTKFRTSRLDIIYSLFIGALLTCFAVFNYTTTESNLTSGSYVTIGAQWLQFCVNNGFSVLIIIANSSQRSKVVGAFNVIFDTRDRLQKIPDHGELNKDIFYGTIIVLITIFLYLLTTLTSYFDNEKSIGYYWFAYGILFFLNTLVVLQYLFAVVKIGMKFKALNVQLEDFIGELQMAIAKGNNNAELINAKVNKVADDHLELINQTKLLNSAFSYQLLLCFVAALAISVTGLYLISKRTIQYAFDVHTYSDPSFLREKQYDWWCLSCYPLLHSILLGTIIIVCHWTMNQSTLLDGTLPRMQRTVQHSESSIISGFSHQIILQRISFTVFHLFTINPSIICSIISTVLTYLIILVQFEISQDIGNTLQEDTLNSVLTGVETL